MAKNLQQEGHADPDIGDIFERSRFEWLEDQEIQAVFELVEELPLSTEPANAFLEGLYLYERHNDLDLLDWEHDNHLDHDLLGDKPIRCKVSHYAFPLDPAVMSTLERRVYECIQYTTLCLVHYRSIHLVPEEDSGRGDEGNNEAGGDEGNNEIVNESGEDGVAHRVDIAAAVTRAAIAMDLGDDYHGSDVAPVATCSQAKDSDDRETAHNSRQISSNISGNDYPVRAHLRSEKVLGLEKVNSYMSDVLATASEWVADALAPGGRVRIDPRGSNVPHSPVMYSYLTVEGMKNSHLRDAAALAHFWAWLEEEVHKNANLTEVDVANRLLEFRSVQDGFMDASFDTISGSGANGAIIHYKPEPESCSRVDPQKLFLLDSGAQYVDGTTDITRTVHFCEPSAREKECFTRVLQGHIALDQAVFPEGTPGFVLDGFARSSLWKVGLDYRHGTGHGVGAALNVHEGPQSISFRYGNMTPLQNGMIVSNEPGYYEDHAFGIRIENLLHVRDAETPNRFGGATYLGFEKLTFFPIQTKMVDVSLLSHAEIDWLNSYHAEVWEKVSPLLEGPTQQWLWNNTRPLAKP